LFLIAVRSILAGGENFCPGLGGPVEPPLDQAFTKGLLFLRFPVEADDLLAGQPDQRIAVPEAMVEEGEGVVLGQGDQPE